MPTELDLINFEKIAAILFIISGVEALSSAYKAEQAELEKQQNPINPSNLKTADIETAQLALDSTFTTFWGYIIYLIIAVIRKNQIQASSPTKSIAPNLLLIIGFIFSIIGIIIRIPAIQQGLSEAQEPIIL
ncbi:MAG: hypothetical protein AAGU27_14910 [Dehalobacterium sp.]